MLDIYQGVLFEDFNSVKMKSDSIRRKLKYDSEKRRVLNIQWHNNYPVEGKEDMPLLKSYNGPLPEHLVSFSERSKGLYSCGLHCYEYDYKIDPAWNNPSKVVPCLQNYHTVLGPDYSIFVDQPRAINVWNVFRNRWISSYWQANHIKVIPSASWGNVNSFEYCFDGLPEDSVIAIGHIVKGSDRNYKKLYRLGVEALVDKKSPSTILVYGSPLDFDPGVKVVTYEGSLHKIRDTR